VYHADGNLFEVIAYCGKTPASEAAIPLRAATLRKLNRSSEVCISNQKICLEGAKDEGTKRFSKTFYLIAILRIDSDGSWLLRTFVLRAFETNLLHDCELV
jgi:hypothetical protein